jgi:hypothetical protein
MRRLGRPTCRLQRYPMWGVVPCTVWRRKIRQRSREKLRKVQPRQWFVFRIWRKVCLEEIYVLHTVQVPESWRCRYNCLQRNWCRKDVYPTTNYSIFLTHMICRIEDNVRHQTKETVEHTSNVTCANQATVPRA